MKFFELPDPSRAATSLMVFDASSEVLVAAARTTGVSVVTTISKSDPLAWTFPSPRKDLSLFHT